MTWTTYLLQTNIYLVIFYSFYVILLRNETFFKLNRIYLVSSGFLSFLIPLMEADWVRALFVNERVYQVAGTLHVLEFTAMTGPSSEAGRINWLLVVYLLGLAVFSARLIVQLLQLLRKRDISMQPYSFFRKIVIADNQPGHDAILKHETIHARQLHSADVLLFEVIAIVNWFNPIAYFYKKDVKYIHEFIADETAAANAESKSDYSLLLLSTTFGIAPSQLSNSFFNESLLKRRIRMLHKSRSRGTALLKYGLTAPLFLLMIIFSSATIAKNGAIGKIRTEISKMNILRNTAGPEENIAANPTQAAPDRKDSINNKGDINSLYKFVGKNTVYATTARENNVQGQAAVTFTISPSGTLQDIAVKKGPGYGIDEEVVKTLKKADGLDASLAGKYFLRINFKLNDANAVSEQAIAAPAGYKELSPVTVVGYPRTEVTGVRTGDGSSSAIHDFAKVDVMPEFPGGFAAFYKYIGEQYRYSEEAKKNNISGRLILSFIVEKDGGLEDIRILRDLGMGTGEEAVRILKESPKWKPGMQDGKPVRVMYTLPIMVNANNNVNVQSSPNGLTIRGNNDLSENVLYIVDDKEMSASAIKEIKTESIESISVLKDAAAKEKYGEKGKNGVVVITLKKPANEQN